MLGLFAVYLGGRAPGCRTELHDVAFAVGETIEDCHPQLLDAWFGAPEGLHIDSWVKFGCVDGYEVSLVPAAAVLPSRTGAAKLFFVNIGGYAPERFMEFHAGYFLVGNTRNEVKARAKGMIGAHMQLLAHTDDMIDVDDCLELQQVSDYAIILTPAPGVTESPITNGYMPFPPQTIAAWKANHLHALSAESFAE